MHYNLYFYSSTSSQHNGMQTIMVNLDVFKTTGTQMPTKMEVKQCLRHSLEVLFDTTHACCNRHGSNSKPYTISSLLSKLPHTSTNSVI